MSLQEVIFPTLTAWMCVLKTLLSLIIRVKCSYNRLVHITETSNVLLSHKWTQPHDVSTHPANIWQHHILACWVNRLHKQWRGSSSSLVMFSDLVWYQCFGEPHCLSLQGEVTGDGERVTDVGLECNRAEESTGQ